MTEPWSPSGDADGWAAPSGSAPIGPPSDPAPYGQAPYGQAPNGQAPYGQAPYGPAPHGQPPDGAAGYPVAQGWGYGLAPATNEGLATASLVVSVVGVVLSFLCGIGLLLEIAALPMSIVARRRIRASGGALTGDGQALAALIISALVLALAVVLIVVLVVLSVAGSGSNP